MAPRGRELEGSTATLLPADLGEVGELGRRARVVVRGRRLDRVLASEVSDGLRDVPDANRLDARQRRLPRRLRRAEEAREAGTSGAFGGRDRPRDGPDAAVEPELADTRVLREPVGRHLPRRRKHGEGDRDVEARSLLAERRRGQVDRDDLAGPLEQRRVDPAADAVLRLLARAVGQPHDGERRLLTRAQVRFDIDAPRLETDERERDRATEHGSTVRPYASRERDGFVPGS